MQRARRRGREGRESDAWARCGITSAPSGVERRSSGRRRRRADSEEELPRHPRAARLAPALHAFLDELRGGHAMRLRSAAILVLSGALAAPVLAHHHMRHHAGSSDVRAAQEKLTDMGYDVGAADGKVGPKTRAALKKFQSDKGLDQTGRLDDHTRAALNADHGSTTSGAR